MASSVSSHPPSKWERTGDPDSAFRGLSRSGRGGRGRGGHRSSRGGVRGKPGHEPKIIIEENGTSLRQSQPQLTLAKSASEKTITSPAYVPNAKQSQRRAEMSQANIVVPVTQAASLPSSAKPYRRRRSQFGKPNTNNQHHPSVGTSKVSELPPNKASITPVPVPRTKDIPPHLKRCSDMRHDIDALVERVRAVAMDNRPTTPGSHIDWAGDDDDSLPDLDDWGVKTSSFASTTSDTISPIIVEGLRPLPDILSPMNGTSLRQVVNLDSKPNDNVQTDQLNQDTQTALEKDSVPPQGDQGQISACNTPNVSKARNPVKEMKVDANGQLPLPPKFINAPQPLAKTFANRKPWHPSLPAKPMSTSTVLNFRPGSRRPISNAKSISYDLKGKTSLQSSCTPELTSAKPVGGSDLEDVPLIVEPVSTEGTMDVEPRPSEDLPRIAAETSKSTAQLELGGSERGGEDISSEDDTKEGLEASIHAPKLEAGSALTESSVPMPHSSPLTHRKAHTAGRIPPFSRGANSEHHSRSARSNNWSSRGGIHTATHIRNHSSPPVAGSPAPHRHTSRPVLTGDAISKLARTIGHMSPTT